MNGIVASPPLRRDALRVQELPTTRLRSQPDRRYLEVLVASGLLLVAAFLRFARLDQVQYREDDDELWNIVTRMVHSGQVPLTGMHSSLGLPNGPFQALLLAPFAWIGASPPLMTVGVGFLNVLAVALVYGFARDFFGRGVALLALLLVAVNPWPVVLSRRLWGDDMVAPFAVLAWWMLCRWLIRRDDRALIVAAAALAIVGQVYIVGLACLVPAVVALLLGARRLRTWWAAGAVAVFVVLMAPYAAGAVAPQLLTVRTIDSHAGQHAAIDGSALRYALDLASVEGYQAFALQGGGRLDATSGLPAALGWLARALYALGLGIGFWTLLRGPGRLSETPRGPHAILLTAVAVPVLALARHAVPIYPYYLVSTFPAPYLYSALAIQRLWAWGTSPAGSLAAWARGNSVGNDDRETATGAPRLRSAVSVRRWLSRLWGSLVEPANTGLKSLIRPAVVVALAALVATEGALAVVFFAVIGQYWPASVYGMPWSLTEHLVTEAMGLQQQLGAARIVVPEHNQELNVLYRVLVQRGVDAAEFEDTRMLVIPAQRSLYLSVGDQRAQRYLLSNYARYVVRQETLPGNGVIARFYLLPASAASDPLPEGATTLNWTATDPAGALARLDGILIARRADAGQTIEATLFTTALRHPDQTVPDFSLFAHLIDSGGNAVAQHDEAAWPSTNWRPGDRAVEWLDQTLPASTPPGLLGTLLGIYSAGTPDRPGVHPLDLTDSSGRSLGGAGGGPALVVAPPLPTPPMHPLVAQLAGGIKLDGYDLTGTGQSLVVTLHWAAEAAVPRDYTAFVHVLNTAGKLVAQSDSQPDDGQFPTSFWRAGDRVANKHTIALPPGLPAGSYLLEFGLYDLRTLRRLEVVSGRAMASMRVPLPN